MKRVVRLAALGVGAYVLILIVTFPATRISASLEDRVADLAMNGVSGSLFSGQARQVVYQGLDLGTIHWQFRPWLLLLGRLEYKVELDSPANSGHLYAGKTLTGRTYLDDVDIEVLPDRLVNHYSLVTFSSSGTMQLLFETLSPGEDYSGEVAGRVIWRDAVILEPVSLVLGQLEMDVSTRDGQLVGQFEDSGDLGVSGEVALSPVNEYRVDLLLRPGAAIDADTRGLLEQYLQADGDYRIDLSGQF